MDDREFEQILASAELLKRRESEAPLWTDHYSDMNSIEKSMLLDELFALRKSDQAEREKLLSKLDRMSEQLLSLTESSQMYLKQNEELKQLIASLQQENARLKELQRLSCKTLYGSKSQKMGAKKPVPRSCEEDKGDFDGTSSGSNVPPESGNIPAVPSSKQERLYRKGMSYKRMKADKSVFHASDLSRLPEGSVVIKTFFLAHLAFNHFVLNVPYYREMYRLNDECMSLSRMTLIAWLHKGAAFTSK